MNSTEKNSLIGLHGNSDSSIFNQKFFSVHFRILLLIICKEASCINAYNIMAIISDLSIYLSLHVTIS